MPHFEIVGTNDPFVLVKLKQGEEIFAESDCMVTMDTCLDLKGKMQGGLLRSLARKIANDESFFQQSISATRGDGEVLLAPRLPGDVQLLEIGTRQYYLNDGAFLASDADVDIKMKMQGVGNALFAGSGGFVIMKTSGHGTLAVSGFGAVFELDVPPEGIIVDNFHVIAWDAYLDYDISVSTAKQGFLSNLVNSQLSGEGVVLKFNGAGKILVCSRNRGSFMDWIISCQRKN